MGIKIHTCRWKDGTFRICVSFDVLQYRRKTKTFKLDQRLEALDFANSLETRYINAFDDELRSFAQKTEHPILTSKNLCFC